MVAQDPSGFPQSFQFSNYSNLSASGPDLQRIKELNRTANVDDLQSCLKPLDNQRVRTSEAKTLREIVQILDDWINSHA